MTSRHPDFLNTYCYVILHYSYITNLLVLTYYYEIWYSEDFILQVATIIVFCSVNSGVVPGGDIF